MKFYTKCMKIGQVTAEDRREFRIGEGIEHRAAARCASFLRARFAPLSPRNRVPSLASPSLGHYAALSFIVRGRGEIISDFGFGIADFGFIKEIRNQETGGRHEAESIGKRVGGWRYPPTPKLRRGMGHRA